MNLIPISAVSHPIPNPAYGSLYTLEEWENSVKCRALIDYDGYGVWSDGSYISGAPPSEQRMHMHDDLVASHLPAEPPNPYVYPSNLMLGTLVRPAWATHILWYNQ